MLTTSTAVDSSINENVDVPCEVKVKNFKDIFEAARQEALEALDARLGDSSERQQHAQRCRLLRSRHHSQNFTYGDTSFEDFQLLLQALPLPTGRPQVFVDLGCGTGDCLFAAALLQRRRQLQEHVFHSVVGVDLMFSKLEQCRLTWQCLLARSALPAAAVEIREQDLFDTDLTAATVVYACATCFSAETVLRIQQRCADELSVGVLVVLLDKQFDDPHRLALLFTHCCRTSWGVGTAFVYRRL
jgi:SAM-dependent methyltransferase